MDKTRINLDIILPGLGRERDECVNEILKSFDNNKGINKVHVVHEEGSKKAELCFHYDPAKITINKIEQLAKNAGAEVTELFGHLLIETSGVRHPRQARVIEAELQKQKGIHHVSVSGTGFIQVVFDREDSSEEQILGYIAMTGLKVKQVDDFHSQMQKEAPNEKKQPAASADKHGHEHGGAHSRGVFGEKTALIFAIICGALLGIGFGVSFIKTLPENLYIGIYVAAYFFGGFFTTKEAISGLSNGNFEIDFLMLVAAVGAAFLGQWGEGALLLFLFSLGHSLEHYALEKARKSIAALTELAPKTALLKTGNDVKEIIIEELKAGDIIIVKPNSAVSADGVVVYGNSSVNQAPITGESMPVDKIPAEDPNISLEAVDKMDTKYRVFAGSLNGSQALEIKVTKVAANSTIARMLRLVNEAQTQKSPTQNFTDKLEKYYVPSVLIFVGLLLLAFLVIDESFSASFYRAMAVLIAASPCALAISTPSAVLSGVARAARGEY